MYELLFWKYLEGIYLNHHEVYEAIVEEQAQIEGLEALPVHVILNRIASVFSKWEKVDDKSWKNNAGIGAFHIRTTPQSIKVDCYGTDGKSMDTLVSVMEEFKCALYDPQVPQRYDEMAE